MNKYVERVRREDRGFTLIELLVVIVILAILAGIVIFAVGGIKDRGKTSACKTDLKTIQVAVEAYYAKKAAYPPDLKPSLTVAGSDTNFLRDDPAFIMTGTTSVKWDPGNGYTIDYQTGANLGQVWVNGSATGTC